MRFWMSGSCQHSSYINTLLYLVSLFSWTPSWCRCSHFQRKLALHVGLFTTCQVSSCFGRTAAWSFTRSFSWHGMGRKFVATNLQTKRILLLGMRCFFHVLVNEADAGPGSHHRCS